MNIYISDVLSGLAFVLSLMLLFISLLSYVRARIRRLFIPAFISFVFVCILSVQLLYSFNSKEEPNLWQLLLSLIELICICAFCVHWVFYSKIRREVNG
ncbi:MAG: hypothetical protein QXT63_02950 [Thermoplasmata archaeon]